MAQLHPIHERQEVPVSRTASIAKGALFLIIGLAVLLHQIPETRYLMPGWLFGVHSLIILIGIYKGIKTNFKSISWLLLLIIGTMIGAHHFEVANANVLFLYGIPLSLIALGLFIIFNKR
ncbi:MAG: hypothetical protein EOP54_01015 [Sphingobacteriales bacterium]|nr:MAG: hypothetical protein EOP54_01015 [Sphingobacteriales bacterium]